MNDDRLTLGHILGSMQKPNWVAWLLAYALALVPLGTWTLVQYMVGQHVVLRAEATRELIFFAVSTFSGSVIAVVDTTARVLSRLMLCLSLIGTIAAAVAYGAFLTGDALHAAARLRGAYHVSIGAAVLASTVSVIAQLFVQRSPSHGVH